MNAKQCDICGQFYKKASRSEATDVYDKLSTTEELNNATILNSNELTFSFNYGSYVHHQTIDICPDCRNAILTIINRRLIPSKKIFEEPEFEKHDNDTLLNRIAKIDIPNYHCDD